LTPQIIASDTPCAAAGVLDDVSATLQPAVLLGGLDHGQRHAVLHAAGWVFAFHLEENAGAGAGNNGAERDQRRIADPFKNGCLAESCP